MKAFLLALGTLCLELVAQAQDTGIYYIRTPSIDSFQLARINADGSGDTTVALGAALPTYPSWSKDGSVLALTGVNPDRPFKISQDVFTYEPGSGRTRLLVPFQDSVGTDPILTNGLPVGTRNKFSYVLPLFKAFSADKARIAVAGLITSGFYQTQQPTNVNSLSGVTQMPILQIYGTADGLAQELVSLGRVRTFYTLGGFGVDWHPTENFLVAPIDVDAPTDGAFFPSESSALFLIEAVPNAIALGRGRQLTKPHGFLQSSLFTTTAIIRSDYAPAFSPDGQSVAYLRAENIIDSSGGVTQHRPIQITIRAVNYDGSNDRDILQLAAGVFSTQVKWSPDGKQLVFDLGHQPTPQPLQLARLEAEPATLEVSIVNADGTNPHPLHAPSAGMPAWRPGSISGPRVSFRLLPGNPPNLVISWDSTVANFAVESAAQLGSTNWQALQVPITSAAGESSVTVPLQEPAGFFRLRSF